MAHRRDIYRREGQHRLGIAMLLTGAMILLGSAPACGGHGAGADAEQRTVGEPEPLPSPAPGGSAEPNLSVAGGGGAHLTWLQPTGEDTFALRMATWTGDAWTRPRTVAEERGMFVNWADFPSLVEADDGTLWAHWLRRSGPSAYAYDVMLTRSTDGGDSWEAPFSPHRDGTATEHGFVSLVPGDEGSVTAVWLDGRDYAGVDLDADGIPRGSMALRAAELGAERREASVVLDDRTCDCCQTAAVRVGDELLVAYRDRSPEEVRDISAVVRADGAWSEPVAVTEDGWQIPGCPVNGPSLAAHGDRAVVAWFAMVEGAPRVQAAFTDDAGRSFDPPVVLAEGNEGVEGHATLGRVDVEWLDADTAVVTWLTATGSDTAEIRFRRVDRDGTTAPPRVLASTHPSRASGFPRLVRTDAALLAAWTVPDEGIRMARLPAGGMP